MDQVHELRREDVPLFDADEMITRAVEFRPVRNIGSEITIGPVQNVPEEDGAPIRYQVIDASKKVVLPTDVRIIHERLPGARSCSRGSEEFGRVARQRIHRHRVADRLPHGRVRIFRHWRAAGPAGCRRQELVCAGIRDRHDVSNDLLLTQSFVVRKEKRLVRLDGATEAAAELVLMVRRRLRSRVSGLNHGIEKVARFELVVAQKLVRRAV